MFALRFFFKIETKVCIKVIESFIIMTNEQILSTHIIFLVFCVIIKGKTILYIFLLNVKKNKQNGLQV